MENQVSICFFIRQRPLNSKFDILFPTDSTGELKGVTEYTIEQKLKGFSDWLINIMVSSNLDVIFPEGTREYAQFVEELWSHAAIQATYSRRNELELPRVASYFLDKVRHCMSAYIFFSRYFELSDILLVTRSMQ